MKEILITMFIGIIAGIIDILPMIKMKLDKYSIASAFVHYLVAAFIIINLEIFSIPWWLKGSIISLALAIPVIINEAKHNKKSIAPMTVTSIILGALIGIAGYYLV
jgi:hypothetical protein